MELMDKQERERLFKQELARIIDSVINQRKPKNNTFGLLAKGKINEWSDITFL